MRIVHYHPRAQVGDGGITNSVRRLSEALVRAGAEAVIAFDGAEAEPSTEGVEWIPVPHTGPAWLRLPTGLAGALGRADLLVLNSAWTAHNVRAGAVASALGVPYVLAPRGAYDPLILRRRRLLKRAWWMTLERRLVQRASAVHVFFESQGAHLRSLGFDGALLVAPNGVAAPGDVRWDGGSSGHVVYVGRYDPEHKGLDLLVEAVASLPAAQRPEVRLHGPDWRGGKRRVADLVAELDVGDRVLVGDAVYGAEKWALLRQAAGFVYPSRWEGFGNSPAEAAALGVPVLVTPYALGRYLAERGAALLAEPTPGSLAEGLTRLRSPEAAAVGVRAAELVEAELTWDAVARSWLDQAKELV